jgi:Ran GTPase-activating protein (RanGAP) involved in mRNA processing and transport
MSLRDLDVSDNTISLKALQELMKTLKEVHNLKVLNVRNNVYSSEEIGAISSSLALLSSIPHKALLY